MANKWQKFSLVVCWQIFSLTSYSLPQEYLPVPGPNGFIDVSSYLEILEDKEHRLTFQDVTQKPLVDHFSRHPYPVANFSFSKSAFWLRLKIESQSQFVNRLYLELAWPPLDYIDLYDTAESLGLRQGGELRFYNLREVQHRNHIFVLDFAPQEKKTLYLKVVSDSILVFPITIYDPDIFHKRDRQIQFLYGIYFGIFVVLALYNLLLFFSLRERLHLQFTLLLLCFCAYMLVYKGFSLEIFLSRWQQLHNWLNPILLALLVALMSRFTQSYLDIASLHERLDRVFSSLFYVSLLHALTIPWQNYRSATQLNNLLLVLVVSFAFLASILALSQKKPMAMTLFFSTILLLLSSLLTVLGNFAVLPNMVLVVSSVQFMSVVVALGFTFSLSHLVKRMRLERDDKRATLSRIKDDFAIAKRIQLNILPGELDSCEYYHIQASYLPKYDLGGDFYDYRVVAPGKLSAIIADVTGHGVSAALFASMLKIAYTHETEALKEPARLLNRIDQSLQSRLGDHFITAAAIYLDALQGELVYAHAGHPPILYYQGSQHVVVELKAQGPAIGLMQLRSCEAKRQLVSPGDRLLLFTDGITELCNRAGELYSLERLKQVMLQHAKKNAVDFKLELLRQLAYHKGDLAVVDDITFVVIDIM